VDTIVPVFVFFIVPFTIVTIIATINMVLVYLAVRSQEAASEHWRMQPIEPEQVYIDEELYIPQDESTGKPRLISSFCRARCCFKRSGDDLQSSQKVVRAVFWQCICYLCAFYISWPLLISAQYQASSRSSEYYYWCVIFFFAPLQGFWNFLIYSRPKYLKLWRKRKPSSTTTRNAEDIDTSTQHAHVHVHADTQGNGLPSQ
jgi:hypothetical protein